MTTSAEIRKISDKYAWFVERGQCGVVEKGSNGYWTSPTEVFNLRMFSTKTADPFTGVSTEGHDHLSEESEIPSQFHMGIVSKAISDLYKTPNSLNHEAAQMFELEYMKAVKRGRKFSKRHHISVGRVLGVDY